MIYLIDDKIKRQEGFGWTVRELEENKNFIKAFHTYSQFSDLTVRTEIFKDGNVILFHESFFDAEKNKQNKDVNDIKYCMFESKSQYIYCKNKSDLTELISIHST